MLANIVVACFTPVEVASLMTHDDWRVRLPLGIIKQSTRLYFVSRQTGHTIGASIACVRSRQSYRFAKRARAKTAPDVVLGSTHP